MDPIDNPAYEGEDAFENNEINEINEAGGQIDDYNTATGDSINEYIRQARIYRDSWPTDSFTPNPDSVERLNKVTTELRRKPDLGFALRDDVVAKDFLDNLTNLNEFCKSESKKLF